MIKVSASTQELVQRLRERAAKIAATVLAQRGGRTPARHEWRSAKALWPDIFEENRDGK